MVDVVEVLDVVDVAAMSIPLRCVVRWHVVPDSEEKNDNSIA
jgi:hypothetical protein